MKRSLLVSVFILGLLLNFSCSKEKLIKEPDTTIQIAISHKQAGSTSFTLKYAFDNNPALKSGIIFSEDSISLSKKPNSSEKTEASKEPDLNQINLIKLKPNTRYWYSIYIETDDGEIKYSDISSFYTSALNITLHIPDTDQQPVFSRTCDSDICPDVLFSIGNNSSFDIEQLEVLFNNQPCELSISENPEEVGVMVVLPKNTNAGEYPFVIKYFGQEVLWKKLEFLRGHFEYVTTHPAGRIVGYHFVYNEKVHSYFYDEDGNYETSIWDPATNQWNIGSTTIHDIDWGKTEINGKEIDGMIYFTPKSSIELGAREGDYVYYEYIYSLDPRTNKTKRINLYEKQGDARMPFYLETLDTFAHNGILYCLVEEYRELGNFIKYSLRTYNPATNEWKHLMDMPITEHFGGGRIVVYGQKLYFLRVDYYTPTVTVKEIDNHIFEIDLNTLTSRQLPVNPRLVHYGALGSYFFEYRGSLFVFGGNDYPVFHEYDLQQNKWIRSAMSYGNFPSFIGTFNGFCVKINDVIYTGFGYHAHQDKIYKLSSW